MSEYFEPLQSCIKSLHYHLYSDDSCLLPAVSFQHSFWCSSIIFIGHAKSIGRVKSLSLIHSLRAQANKADVGSLISFVTWLKAIVMIDNSQWIPLSIGYAAHGICPEVFWVCIARTCQVSCKLTGCSCMAADGSGQRKGITITAPISSAASVVLNKLTIAKGKILRAEKNPLFIITANQMFTLKESETEHILYIEAYTRRVIIWFIGYNLFNCNLERMPTMWS